MPNGFESIDQIFKTTSFIRSTVDGYTEAQIRKMRTFIKLEKDDIFEQIVDGSPRFVLTPDKALELAQVTFMNYAAMPAAIKMIRSIPLVGSPFASFVYANAAKTGSTFVHNPTAFNKISYALNEFGGTKSPLEKTAIYDSSNPSNQYYSYLGKPGMYKVPFITDNPVYVNFASMVPPLSMNMFAPETSNYATPGFPESVMNVLNKSTLMGDPVGQLLKNYVVQPMLLRDELMLRGAFGQALFPSDATTAEKIAYAARDTAEAFVPGVASFPVGIAAGLAEKTGIGPDPEWLPLYKARKTARSVMGENVMGISGKEPVMSRVAREAAGAVGVPVQSPLNIGYIESNQ
jgi:hypothetical protein